MTLNEWLQLQVPVSADAQRHMMIGLGLVFDAEQQSRVEVRGTRLRMMIRNHVQGLSPG